MKTVKEPIDFDKSRGDAIFTTNEKGEFEMVGYILRSPMEVLRDMLGEFFEPDQVTMADGLNGFLITPKGTQWDDYTFLTAYCSMSANLFSIYRAIPDIWKGIDIDDEKPLIVKAYIGQCREAIKTYLKEWNGATKTMTERKSSLTSHLDD